MKLLSFLLPTTSECRNREAPGDFAAGAGGTVASSRAAISSLVSFPLGLDRPSSEFLLVMFPQPASNPKYPPFLLLASLFLIEAFSAMPEI